jgi:hypothetical protein
MIKDWKKVDERKEKDIYFAMYVIWDNKKTGRRVIAQEIKSENASSYNIEKDKGWRVSYYPEVNKNSIVLKDWIVLKNTKTKSQALKFAKAYMWKH